MNRGQAARVKEFIFHMVKLLKAKSHDYSGKDDMLANFKSLEKFGYKASDGILYRMGDKFNRLAVLLKNPAKVKDEKIQDTLLDLANYACIMYISLHEDLEKTSQQHRKRKMRDDYDS